MNIKHVIYSVLVLLLQAGCGARGSAEGRAADSAAEAAPAPPAVEFSADSAYAYLARQVEFGPRVTNSEAHARAADWLASELRRHGAEVTEQRADLKAFDGVTLHARNIFGRFNPGVPGRILLLAHYDSRPWADNDPDPANRSRAVDGANDGASGVAVLLEVARQLKASGSSLPVDILFVDAEDRGTEGDDSSWALGARYFAQNPPVEGYAPDYAVLLDMVGGIDARFPREYISQVNAPGLNDRFWQAARIAGHADRFPQSVGAAVTDDHVELLKQGIPAIDIIEYREGAGFNPAWHTISDNLSNISRETLGAVGETLMVFLSGN